VLLAQTSPDLVIPDVAWSAFAPELLVTAVALALLLIPIAKGRLMVVAAPVAAAFVAVGAWLITQGLAVPGATTVIVGASLPAAVAAYPRRASMVQAVGAGVALAGALALTAWQYVTVLDVGQARLAPQEALAGSLANDGIVFFARITIYLTALLVVPLGYAYLNERRINRAEVEPLLLLATVGMVALATANDVVTIFVALEVFSLALYVLSGLARRDRRSQEAGLKYFVMGAVASAILLYGMALLYVATGHLDLPGIGASLALVTTDRTVAALGLGLVLVGVGFKVSLVPFMLWTPDVYQGAPTNVTAFMAAATKVAGFAVLLRLTLVAFPAMQTLWVPVLAVLAAASMVYGAYVALVQRDLKRMLAYSSITHAGYATIGVVAVSDQGLSATLFYLLAYAVSTVAAFGCVLAVERARRGEVTLVDLRGLGKTSPAMAGILSLALLSLAGIPPTAGFVGKLLVFQAGLDAGLTWLVVVGVVSTVVAAFFYLRIAGMMFLEEPDTERPIPEQTTGMSLAIAVAAALVVFLGIQPGPVLDLVETAAALVR
jgi:NADH-quinone oxidoreductase subunit N